MKIVGWALRPDTNCVVDEMLYGIVVRGLCRGFRTVEALMVVKRMVEGGVVVGSELRSWVYRSLLREARIKEALELNEVLGCDLVSDGGGDNLKRVIALLDQMINNWTK
ncbi:hypothetical protein IFM89_034364 [Coptis chinensis]|uniref:Pentatricopeptide repeat-containing protein n=1 Tax=Coptis chinensis TaxID=261450 RepID=A0A835H8M0_9MAGN|nr:hypothetical protein IFM89_034364 [Coptis chinensis]